jgi:hypothetical protein
MHRTREQARSAARAFIVNDNHIVHQAKRAEWASIDTAAATNAQIFVDFQWRHGFSL